MSVADNPIQNVWACGAPGCGTYRKIRRRVASAIQEGWQRAVGERDGRAFAVTRCPAHRDEFDAALAAAAETTGPTEIGA